MFISHADSSKCLKSISATASEKGILYVTTTARTEQYFQLLLSCVKDAWVIEGTNYVEHKHQTFTFPLGNEKLMLGDYLADDGIHHVRGQVDLSTLTWSVNSFPNQNNTLCLSGSYNQSKSKQGQNTLLCNRFKEQIQYNVDNEGIDCYTNGYGFTLRILKSRLSEQTAMGVKTWLQANLSIVEYELNEEVIVPYTSAQQTVYNQIKQALSYEEQTNISSNTIALFNVKAFKNMNTSIESLQSRIELLKGRS